MTITNTAPMTLSIAPHLWFDTQAREAVSFNCSLIPDSRIENITTVRGTPSGECDAISFTLAGQPFMAVSAGPNTTFNPSISFFINFDPSRDIEARAALDATWKKLAEGGQVLMPLDAYPFSQRYGWIQDRYGISWLIVPTELNEMLRSDDPAASPGHFSVCKKSTWRRCVQHVVELLAWWKPGHRDKAWRFAAIA